MLPHALQEIADSLKGRRAQVLGEVEGLSQTQADWRPAPGEWSLGEVLHHLVLAEAIGGKIVSVAIRRAVETGAVPPYPADALVFGWQPPSSDDRWVVPVPEPAAPAYGQSIAELRQAMANQDTLTHNVLQRLAGLDPHAITAAHPLIGMMNAAQWLMFCDYHMLVHLRQMRDIKTSAAFPWREDGSR